MTTQLVIFDLDGTLIDSAAEIADAVNDLLRHESLPALSLECIRELIGHGARATVAKAYARSQARLRGEETEVTPNRALLARLMVAYGTFFLARCGTRSTVFPQVRSTLEQLDRMGIKLALVTNKEECFTRPLLASHGLLEWFDPVVSGDTLSTRKPDAAPLLRCLAHHDTPREHALMVGDSVIDVHAARAAGVPVYLLTHGYGDSDIDAQPDRWLHSFVELLETIQDAQMQKQPSAPLRRTPCL